MIIATVLSTLLIYCLFCQPHLCNGIKNGTYLSRERTCTINALMVIGVFFSHAYIFCTTKSGGQFATPEGIDYLILNGIRKMGQLIVSCFLLFSGYGIMESMKHKGNAYLSGFLRHRFLKVFCQFELGILCYFLVALAWGESFSMGEIARGFVGWESFGNPTWFIVVSLLMYLIAYMGLHYSGWKRWGIIWGLSVILYLFFSLTKASYWYDTLFCFPAGMLLSCYRPKLESVVERMRIPAPLLGILLVGLAYLSPKQSILGHPLIHNIEAIIFAYGMALAFSSLSFRRSPRLLLWIGGSALFSFYFYHMLTFHTVLHYHPSELDSDTFLLITLPSSLFLAWIALLVQSFYEKRVLKR